MPESGKRGENVTKWLRVPLIDMRGLRRTLASLKEPPLFLKVPSKRGFCVRYERKLPDADFEVHVAFSFFEHVLAGSG